MNGGADAQTLRALLLETSPEGGEQLRRAAQQVAVRRFGYGVFLRGLIEVSNFCRNDCLYCGIRRSNAAVSRYRLSADEILDCCEHGYAIGLRTFVLQGGEDAVFSDRSLVPLVRQIRRRWPDCAITLSLGERSAASYRALYEAGANRYLLRHETITPEHYRSLHPVEMSLDNRIGCLEALKRIGFQTGTGVMVGSPGQTVDDLVRDLLFIKEFRPQMIGLGPFIPQADTPFGACQPGDMGLTLRMISLCRLLCPDALIPSTTALATLGEEGRIKGILAGANVVMPNLSPVEQRAKYALYDHKASMGAEAAEGIAKLNELLHTVGYHVDWQRGDYGIQP